MTGVTPKFGGAYVWNFKLTEEERNAVSAQIKNHVENKKTRFNMVWENTELPKPIREALIKKVGAKSFNMAFLSPFKALVVTNDHKGNHLELLALPADEAKQVKTCAKFILNPHGIITTQNREGEGVVFKPVWEIVRFFKGIWNTITGWFSK